MTTKQLVDRGLEIVVQLEHLQKELKLIEERLKQAALQGEQIELIDEEREGRQYLAHGTTAIVPVVLTADLLVQSFADGSPTHARAAQIAGDRLGQFYRAVTTWKMLAPGGKAFRREAAAILGPQAGAQLVTAVTARDKNGIPKSQIKVEWDRKQEIPAA